MADDDRTIVSPADGKILVGSFSETSLLFLKDKFFNYEELLGEANKTWQNEFHEGNFAIVRLTPEKYHYNHMPVAGRVVDIYELPGFYHPCNPAVAVSIATSCSKNKRIVTIIDTDVEGGTGIGLVAMIEIVALMIGDIVQCYSSVRYEDPVDICTGMFLLKGQPKSLYRPGSSTDIVLFQKNRISFSDDLIRNMYRPGVHIRFTRGFVRPLVETEVNVRAAIGAAHDISCRRVLSEFLRADYRGDSKISAYQVMSLVSIGYGISVLFMFPVPPSFAADIIAGMGFLWDPAVILALQLLWILTFLSTGVSDVTSSDIALHVMCDRT